MINILVKFMTGDILSVEIPDHHFRMFDQIHTIIHQQIVQFGVECVFPRLLQLAINTETQNVLFAMDSSFNRAVSHQNWLKVVDDANFNVDNLTLLAILLPPPPIRLKSVMDGWNEGHDLQFTEDGNGCGVLIQLPVTWWHNYSTHTCNVPHDLVKPLLDELQSLSNLENVTNISVYCQHKTYDYIVRFAPETVVHFIQTIVTTFPALEVLDMNHMCVEYTNEVVEACQHLPILKMREVNLPRPLIAVSGVGVVNFTTENVRCLTNYHSLLVQMMNVANLDHSGLSTTFTFGVHELFDEEMLKLVPVEMWSEAQWQAEVAKCGGGVRMKMYSLRDLTDMYWA